MKEKFYNFTDPELLIRSHQTYSLSTERSFTKRSKSFKIAQDILQRCGHLISKVEPEQDALLCQTLAFNVRKRLLSEAGRKGALRLAENKKRKLEIIPEKPQIIDIPASRPLVDKIKNLWNVVRKSIVRSGFIISLLANPTNILADTYHNQSSKVEYTDPATLERAAKVGQYLNLVDDLTNIGIQTAGKFLSRDIYDIDPSVREAARLNNQFYLETLSNTMTADSTPDQFDEAVGGVDVQTQLKKNAYEEIILWETAGPPQYEEKPVNNLSNFISQLSLRVKNFKNGILRVMTILYTQDPSRSSDLLEIASTFEDFAIPEKAVPLIPHILAEYYDKQITGRAVLRVIAKKHIEATLHG